MCLGLGRRKWRWAGGKWLGWRLEMVRVKAGVGAAKEKVREVSERAKKKEPGAEG